MNAEGLVDERVAAGGDGTRPPAAKAMTTGADRAVLSGAFTSVKAEPGDPTAAPAIVAEPVTVDVDFEAIKSPGRGSRAPSTFSMEDLEVAKALTGMREASPASSNATMRAKSLESARTQPSGNGAAEPEPLLSLLVSQHPLVATAINGSLSAYTSSKSYSSHFRVGAEFVERNIASPMASTVGTAGRLSGVETGMRWWLQRNDSAGAVARTSSDARNGGGASTGGAAAGSKRRREGSEMDIDGTEFDEPSARRSRAESEISHPETLPAYDDQRSPKYEETPMMEDQESSEEQQQQQQQQQRSSSAMQSSNPLPQTWQTRLMMSTSGLGVAMSEESLRSLKYCFSWLRWANSHLARLLVSLQDVLQEWDRSQRHEHSDSETDTDTDFLMDGASSTMSGATAPSTNGRAGPPRDQVAITRHLQALKGECVQTLKNALDVVSKYAGGALPENARWLVRRHLTSLPQRFRAASTSSSASSSSSSSGAPAGAGAGGDEERQGAPPTPEAVTGARRVVVLAREGLDMMAQVSAVVNGTIVSAEEWCERLGRRRSTSQQQLSPPPPPHQQQQHQHQQQQQQQQQQMAIRRQSERPDDQQVREQQQQPRREPTPNELDVKMAVSP